MIKTINIVYGDVLSLPGLGDGQLGTRQRDSHETSQLCHKSNKVNVLAWLSREVAQHRRGTGGGQSRQGCLVSVAKKHWGQFNQFHVMCHCRDKDGDSFGA